jgi:hypothetical protein
VEYQLGLAEPLAWLRRENSSAEVFGLQPSDLCRRIDPGTGDRPSLKNQWRRKIVCPNFRKHIVSEKFNIAMEAMARLQMIYCFERADFPCRTRGQYYIAGSISHYILATFPVNLDSIPSKCPFNSHYIALHSH